MKSTKLVQVLWYYFRMGHGMYGGFPIGFFGFIVVVYKLALEQIPLFASLHLWGFTLLFGTMYGLAMILTGRLHIRTQNWTEAEVAAPQAPYEYKMKQFGREGKLGMPSSLTSIRVQKATLLLIERIAPDIAREMNVKMLLKELDRWEGMTETLLAGGEIR